MDRFERIIEVPSCYINREVANRISLRINEIANEQGNRDYADALRRLAPTLNLSPEDAIRRYWHDEQMRRVLFVRRDRTIFISPQRNVEYTGREVSYDELPTDPRQIIIDVPGINGKYLNISLMIDPMQVFPLHKGNKILIQGPEQHWVEALYQDFSTEIANAKKVVRDLVYRWFRPLAFGGFVALSFVEFRLYQLAKPEFTMLTPLTGLASLGVFLLLSLNLFVSLLVGGRAMAYVYPYFELQDRLSERRRDLRKLWITTVSAVYGGGLWAVLTSLR